MNKEDHIRTFYYFVKGVLNASVSDEIIVEVIRNEINAIEEMKDPKVTLHKIIKKHNKVFEGLK